MLLPQAVAAYRRMSGKRLFPEKPATQSFSAAYKIQVPMRINSFRRATSGQDIPYYQSGWFVRIGKMDQRLPIQKKT
jgi:hypothetical protein